MNARSQNAASQNYCRAMADPVTAMRAVADLLDQTGLPYAFVGGAIVSLLLDNPALSPARPTDDVDVIVELAANARYSEIEAIMRKLTFHHDMRPGAPKCRWLLGDVIVDLMPTDGASLGLNTQGFTAALATAEARMVRGDVTLRLVSAPAFLALKLAAFSDRGDNDYLGSHDLEDLLTVIDGRDGIVQEINAAPAEVRQHVRDGILRLNRVRDFQDALAAALPLDDASQARLPLFRRKIEQIAALQD